MRFTALLASSAGLTVLPCLAVAQEEDRSLTDFSATWTTYFGGFVQGDGDANNQVEPGTKLDLYGMLDGRDIGLWSGFTINAHLEAIWGKNVNDTSYGILFAPNVALGVPVTNSQDLGWDLTLNFTQRWNGGSLTFGKINMVDSASRTPLVGGGGREGFQHLQFAAPTSVYTPASIWGALATFKTAGPSVTIGLWDPQDAAQEVWPDDFLQNGVVGFLSATQQIEIAGLQGWQGLAYTYSTEDQFDISDYPFLLLPEAERPTITANRNGWFLKYSFQQYLWQDPDDPSIGWGLFGYAGLWDGNPTPYDWEFAIGITGNPVFIGRPQDRFGIGYWQVSLSDDLVDVLEPVVGLGDENGIEAYYTWQVGNAWRLTANAQVIEPGLQGYDQAVILGFRALMNF